MSVITNIEDLRVLAQQRVPRMFYDYADSGSWTEGTYRANETEFQRIKLRQRVAVNMENRSTAVQMVGQLAKMPVAIAPVGLTGMQPADGEPIDSVWPGAGTLIFVHGFSMAEADSESNRSPGAKRRFMDGSPRCQWPVPLQRRAR